MTAIIIFILGLVVGSFLSVVFTRLEVEELHPARRGGRPKADRAKLKAATFGRSRCDHCKKTIPAYDNIPLVSFGLLRGRCRHCGRPISGYHPLLELTSALYLVAAYLAYGFSWQFTVASIFGLVLLLLFAYDLRHQLIPNVIVVPAILLALVFILFEFVLTLSGSVTQVGLFASQPESYLVGGLVAGGFFFALSALSRGTWIGGGDIKLGALIGLLLGWPYVLVALILAYFIGTAYAITLLVTRQASWRTSVPFGPMLVMGFFIAAFYADVIINWYEGWVL